MLKQNTPDIIITEYSFFQPKCRFTKIKSKFTLTYEWIGVNHKVLKIRAKSQLHFIVARQEKNHSNNGRQRSSAKRGRQRERLITCCEASPCEVASIVDIAGRKRGVIYSGRTKNHEKRRASKALGFDFHL